VANPTDDRFGRFVIKVAPADGKGEGMLVRSRTLFADSALVAIDLLWGGHSGATAYRDGEILVIMSMDPFDRRIADPAFERRVAEFQKKVETADQNDMNAIMGLLRERNELERQSMAQPRRIVVHPALHGRELAWSTARIDFWFNDIPGLSAESVTTNGGTSMPAPLRNIQIGDRAQTWQFYELDGVISVNPGTGKIGEVSVVSGSAGENSRARSHYGVSMFSFEQGDGEEGRRVEDLEKELQPMLDWLAQNHHDFVRLNDFAEAFALMRWVHSAQVDPLIYDLDGDPEPIVTPDRVVLGEGPRVR
jgi:hypothetical protein